jgi:hypothetical protein
MDINTAKKIFKSFYCHFVADIAKICIKFCKETFFPSKFIAYTGFHRRSMTDSLFHTISIFKGSC